MLKKLSLVLLSIFLAVNALYASTKEHTGKILELKNGGAYTYIKVQSKEKNYWAAVMKADLKVGDNIALKEQVWMKNFKSKILKETFYTILFADLVGEKMGSTNIHGMHGQNIKKPNPKFNDGITVSKEKAIKVTIKNLYENKYKYKNKNVEISAEVVQVSNKVMGNTWVKLKGNKYTVIFRSPNEDEKVKVGDKVKVVGTVNTDINFGHGYKYEILGVNSIFTKI